MKRTVLAGVLLAMNGLMASGQAVVDGFSIDQITFAAKHTGNIPCSEYGQAGFAVRQVPGLTQYVQVVAQLAGSTTAPAWIVQNVPAVAGILSEGTPLDLTQLGIQRGTCIAGSKIAYTIAVTDNVIAAAPSYSGSSTAFVGQRTSRAEGISLPNPASPGLPPPSALALTLLGERAVAAGVASGLGDLNVTFIDRPGMGNVVQKTNECAPGAITNSMYWLQSMKNIDLKGDTPAQTMSKLESDMNWSAENGATPENIIAGKLVFAQRAEHPLDLEIHYQAFSDSAGGVGDSVEVGTGTATRDGGDEPPTFEYIKKEMAKGQDVELTLQWLEPDRNGNATSPGGHAVAVSGVLSGPGGNSLYFNDDDAQDGKGMALRNDYWVPVGKMNLHIDLHGNSSNKTYLRLARLPANFVSTALSESPKPKTLAYVPLEVSNNLGGVAPAPKPYTTPGSRPALRAAVTGTPSTVPGAPYSTGLQTVAAATALGKFVFAVNYGSNNMSAFKIDGATGSLSPITGSPYSVGSSPFSVTVDPSGRLLYVGNSGSNTISAFTIDAITGVLTPVIGSPFATGQIPADLAVSPSGRLLFVAANGGGVYAYTIDTPTGALTPVPGSPFAAGTNPNSVAVESKGQFVYVVNAAFGSTNSGISVFSLGQTGALTQISGSPFKAGGQPDYIGIDPTGQFAYVANFVSSNVSAFTINASTGALSPIAGSPYTVPAGPFAVAVEPGGQYVYVTSQGNNPGSISAFSIDSNSGALTAIPGSPFPGGGGPARLAFASVLPNVATSIPTPALTQLAPSAAKPGAAVTVVSVFGTNFVPGAVVRWNGVARQTVFESTTQLNVAIPASDLTQAGTAAITVANPAPSVGTSSALTFSIDASLALPSVAGNGTLNDAGFTIGQSVAPGSIATSFGSALASGTSALTSPPSNTVLGSSMKINGGTTPLFFVSSGQVAFQVPWELAGQQRAFATFTSATGTSSPATISVADYAPGIFTMNAAGQGAIVINSTGELTAAAGSVPGIANRPAPRGEYIAIYCTGLGDVTNRPATGAPASLDANSLSRTTTTPAVTIGGVAATPVFSGLAPGFVGLYQIVVQVPAGTPTGNAVPLTVSIGGQNSNTVTIAVQ